MKEILRNINSEEEKEKINNLVKKIKENDYYYIYEDVNGSNSDIVQFFEKNTTKINKSFSNFIILNYFSFSIIKIRKLIIPCENLNYEIELYKIGKTCENLKQRYVIIMGRKFYSSKKTLSQINESNK